MLNVRILSEGWLNDGWLAAYDACVCMNGGTVLAPVCPTMSDGFPLNSFMASNCTRDAEKWKKRESKIHSSTASSCHEIEYGEERRRRFVPFWNWGEKISTFPFFAMIVCRDRKSSYLFKWHDDDISRSFAKTQYILLTYVCTVEAAFAAKLHFYPQRRSNLQCLHTTTKLHRAPHKNYQHFGHSLN